jgi:hypothetical protein
MSRVDYLKRKWQGLTEIGRRLDRDGNWEGLDDVLLAMERIEKQEIPRARAQTRAEQKARAAERRADPNAPRLVLHDAAPSGWVDDPVHRRSLPASVLDRIDEDQRREDALTGRAAQEAKASAPAVLKEQWRSNVLLGLVDPRTVPDFDGPDMVAAGEVSVEQVEAAVRERLADFQDMQARADREMENETVEMGRMCVEALGVGPDSRKALAQLLEGPERVGARHGRERGWG